MSGRRPVGMNVFDAALERMIAQYELGHRIVVSLSGGKDSTVVLEMCLLAAQMTGRLPVEAVTRDEEIMFPGTYEYLERVWKRDDVDLHHLVAGQPIVNAFNRRNPYWWTFDDRLSPDQWVRQPPPWAEYIRDINIEAMTTKARFPVAPGQRLISVIGLRTQESKNRMYGLHSSGGYMTKNPTGGVYGCRPVYDWTDGDVWHAVHKFGWDYNDAYDHLHRLGVERKRLRIGPPSMNVYGCDLLAPAAQAWPHWWDRVVKRLPGMDSAAKFGRRVVMPIRLHGETWGDCFQRECIDKAPAWIAERSLAASTRLVATHRRHSTTPFPDSAPCRSCEGNIGSWRMLANALYIGDPFSMKVNHLPLVQPSQFRDGLDDDHADWHGKPSH